jgi:hypothetical protein
VVSSFRNEKFDKNIMKELGNVGLLGPTIIYPHKIENIYYFVFKYKIIKWSS